MNTKEQAKHTPGAERAAEEIDTAYACSQALNDSPPRRTEVAEIISAETHDAEMLEALKAIRAAVGMNPAPGGQAEEIGAIAHAAILKAEGRS